MRGRCFLATPRVLALSVLLTLGGGVAAPLLQAGGGCAMCREKCCCAPQTTANGSCRLSRPCGTEAPSTGPSTVDDGKAALLGGALPVPGPAAGARLAAGRTAAPADRAAVPPDPPPRPVS